MSKDIKRFKTYGLMHRREYDRRTRDRKAEAHHARLEAIYTRETAPVAARTEY
jgi:hypothetical protein